MTGLAFLAGLGALVASALGAARAQGTPIARVVGLVVALGMLWAVLAHLGPWLPEAALSPMHEGTTATRMGQAVGQALGFDRVSRLATRAMGLPDRLDTALATGMAWHVVGWVLFAVALRRRGLTAWLAGAVALGAFSSPFALQQAMSGTAAPAAWTLVAAWLAVLPKAPTSWRALASGGLLVGLGALRLDLAAGLGVFAMGWTVLQIPQVRGVEARVAAWAATHRLRAIGIAVALTAGIVVLQRAIAWMDGFPGTSLHAPGAMWMMLRPGLPSPLRLVPALLATVSPGLLGLAVLGVWYARRRPFTLLLGAGLAALAARAYLSAAHAPVLPDDPGYAPWEVLRYLGLWMPFLLLAVASGAAPLARAPKRWWVAAVAGLCVIGGWPAAASGVGPSHVGRWPWSRTSVDHDGVQEVRALRRWTEAHPGCALIGRDRPWSRADAPTVWVALVPHAERHHHVVAEVAPDASPDTVFESLGAGSCRAGWWGLTCGAAPEDPGCAAMASWTPSDPGFEASGTPFVHPDHHQGAPPAGRYGARRPRADASVTPGGTRAPSTAR